MKKRYKRTLIAIAIIYFAIAAYGRYFGHHDQAQDETFGCDDCDCIALPATPNDQVQP